MRPRLENCKRDLSYWALLAGVLALILAPFLGAATAGVYAVVAILSGTLFYLSLGLYLTILDTPPIIPTKTPEYLRLRARLCAESKLRGQRPDWIEQELRAMHEEVNLCGPATPVSLGDVRRVEATAVGHSDYAHKFAFYCYELLKRPPGGNFEASRRV